MNRFLIQRFGEVQQQLCQFTLRLQPIRTRPVVPLLIALQLQLHANQFNLQLLGLLALCFKITLLLFSMTLLLIALAAVRAQALVAIRFLQEEATSYKNYLSLINNSVY